MTLRRKVLAYLFALHVVFAALAVVAVWDARLWLLAIEPLFVISFIVGVRLVRAFFAPLELIAAGTQTIADGDFSSRLLASGQAEMDALIGVYNQMIERLREERVRVAEQQSLLTELVHTSPGGIAVLDFDRRRIALNPAAARILGVDGNGAEYDVADLPVAHEFVALEPGASTTLTLRGNRRVRVHMAELLDRGFRRRFLLFEELTDELRRFERAAYERVIRMMSHEINNSIGASNSLLNSCLNYAAQLRPEDRDDFTNALKVAVSRADHLNGFVRSYADVVRLPRPDLRACDVTEILRSTATLMRAEAEARRIAIVGSGAMRPIIAAVDRMQMEQVFVNVLRNAMDAIGDAPGTITLRAAGRLVEIEDTGCGLSNEVREHLFTPFFTTKEKGRGIGLTLVQEILLGHGFDYSLDSAPGLPTVFRIAIPDDALRQVE